MVLFSTAGWINSTLRLETIQQLKGNKAYVRWLVLPGGQNVTPQETQLLQKNENVEVCHVATDPVPTLFGLFAQLSSSRLYPDDQAWVSRGLASYCRSLSC